MNESIPLLLFILTAVLAILVMLHFRNDLRNKPDENSQDTENTQNLPPSLVQSRRPAVNKKAPSYTNQVPAYVAKQKYHPKVQQTPIEKWKQTEDEVELALRGLNEARYFVFRDLIIPTGYKNLPLTQIDHVVVSHYGIFCIETKSNQGSIYGYTKSKNWKQYLGADNIYTINNPYSQNRGHVHALNALLKGTLRAPIHDYVTFPNAKKVTIDGCVEDLSLKGIVEKIAHHTKPVYNDASVERIAKMLAHAATYRNVLRDRHIEEVRAYLEVKVARTLRY